MLTLARPLSRHPHVLPADELSIGLAPLVVKRLLQAVVRGAKQQGTAVLPVEQHVRKALEQCDHAYVMQRGRIDFTGSATELWAQIADIQNHYLAVVAGG
jgi:branched-chain amino acid transport system ATP-binding protein